MPSVSCVIVEGSVSLPVSVNQMYVSAGKRRILSSAARNWKVSNAYLIKSMIKDKRKFKDYALELHYHFPDKRKRDASNYIKLFEDMLVMAGALPDDNLISAHMINRVIDGTREVNFKLFGFECEI